MWNRDYFKFLVSDVWKINNPITILDCGCGYGALGLLLMPLLPAGSKYVGIDFSENMIHTANEMYQTFDYDSEFIKADIMKYKPREKYDMVINQAVLRHMNDGEKYLNKMVEFVKEGGIVISMECNREFEEVGLYIEGMDYAYMCHHDGLKKLWKKELEKQNRDYSIAMKIPHYMKNAGLSNVDCRMNDKVTFLEPAQSEYQEILDSIIEADHWSDIKNDKEIEEDIAYFMNHGMCRKEAEDYCDKQNGIVHYLKENREKIRLTKVTGVMISYGWKY